MNKEQLLARAKELEASVPEGATNVEIEAVIKLAEHPALAKAVKDLDTENQTLKEQLKVKDEAIEALQAKIDETGKQESATKFATFKNSEATYVFAVKSFRYKGDKYEASEAVKDSSLMEALIKAEFIHLKKQ